MVTTQCHIHGPRESKHARSPDQSLQEITYSSLTFADPILVPYNISMGCGGSTESSTREDDRPVKEESKHTESTTKNNVGPKDNLKEENPKEEKPKENPKENNPKEENSKENPKEKNPKEGNPKAENVNKGEFTEFQKKCLEEHNTYRARHGADPMILNEQICKMAQEYAEELAKTDTFEHCPSERCMFNGKSVGENLAAGSGSQDNFVAMWYDEVKDYNFNSQGFGMGTGHFTQVVWKGSKELGIGSAKSPKWTIVVGRYFPAGNMQGAFEENVQPPE